MQQLRLLADDLTGALDTAAELVGAFGPLDVVWPTAPMALREARIEVRIVDPKRVRSFARSAGRLAKNGAIDAEMIAWFAETFTDAPGQATDAGHEKLVQIVRARQGLLDLQTSLQNRSEHSTLDVVQKMQAGDEFIFVTVADEYGLSKPGRQPPEAVARSASLERGRSPRDC